MVAVTLKAPSSWPFGGSRWRDLDAEVRAWVVRLADENSTLKARLQLNSQNSSKPPSTDPPRVRDTRRRPKKSKRKPGGQPGHPRHVRPLVPPECVDHRDDLWPESCRACDRPFVASDKEVGDPIQHQVFEVPEIRPTIFEFVRHRRLCPECRVTTTAPLPEGVPQGCLGLNATSLMALMTGTLKASRRGIADFFSSVFGIRVSVGLVDKACTHVSSALEKPVEAAWPYLMTRPVVYIDDTGWYEKNQRAYVWVCDGGDVVAYRITSRRDGDAVRGLLGPGFSGNVVSDRGSSFAHLPPENRQVCWSHLARDFQAIVDRGGPGASIGEEGVRLKDRLFATWHPYKRGEITHEAMQRRMAHVEIAVGALLETGVTNPDAQARRFCKNLITLSPALFLFSRAQGVEPTNNTSERDLRNAVIWRKLCFGTQSEKGSRFVERLLTVIATRRRQRRSVLEFLREALIAFDLRLTPPSLLLPKIREQPAA